MVAIAVQHNVSLKTWSLDALGNNLSAGTYNAANEETPTQGSSGYDTAGNMTTLQSGKTAKYDAWNRLVEVDGTSGIVERNEYDGTNRRIQIFSDFNGTTPNKVVDNYHLGQQTIESDVIINGNRSGGYQMIWSPRYIDAPILRDTLNTAGTGIVTAERVFYLGDANYNVTGLVKYDSGNWKVAERYTYTPYGVVTYRNADWTTATSSANANTTLYTGRELDLLTGLHYYRARYYDAGLERFISRDPIGYAGKDFNVYRYVGDNPSVRVDPTGEILYAVDGTTNNRDSNTNVWQFYQRTRETKWYWNGPTGLVNGFNSPAIVRGVEDQIRSDYRNFVLDRDKVVIHLVGYSRGAIIAATVARDLDSPGLVLGGQLYIHIPVCWIGLFDAVMRMGPRMTTPGGWATTFSQNIWFHAHAIHTDEADLENGEVLKTVTTLWPTTPFWFEPGHHPTTHQDLGHNIGVLDWMIQQAQLAGVPVQ
jgi:RHS repeat-associated protein